MAMADVITSKSHLEVWTGEAAVGTFPGLDPAGPRSFFWVGMRKAVPEGREAVRRKTFLRNNGTRCTSCGAGSGGQQWVGT